MIWIFDCGCVFHDKGSSGAFRRTPISCAVRHGAARREVAYVMKSAKKRPPLVIQDDITRRVKQRVEEVEDMISELKPLIMRSFRLIETKTQDLNNSIGTSSADELQERYDAYEQSLTAMTRAVGESFGYSTTREADATFSYTDATVFDGFKQWLEHQNESGEDSGNLTDIFEESDAHGLDDLDITPIEVDTSEDDGGDVLTESLEKDGAIGRSIDSGLHLRFCT